MNDTERQLIAGLFERLRGASGAYRDPEAEAFIGDQVRRQPHAPYAMAQTLIVQNQSLEAANARIAELESALDEARSGGRGGGVSPWGPRAGEAMGAPAGYGSGGFGTGGASGRQGYEAAQPYGAPPVPQQPQRGGGGFLSGALQTAAGVAGGALLFSGLSSLFGGGDAKAEEAGSAAKAADLDPNASDASPNPTEQPDGWFSGLLDTSGPDDGGDGGSGGGEDDGGDWL